MNNNHRKTITFHDIQGVVDEAIPLAFHPQNVTAGFRVPGISAFNLNVFRDDEFTLSNVTGRDDLPSTDEVGAIEPDEVPGSLNEHLIDGAGPPREPLPGPSSQAAAGVTESEQYLRVHLLT